MGALELIVATILQSASDYGWHTKLNDVIFLPINSWSVKLSLLSKALISYKPDISGSEGLLNEEEITAIAEHLKNISLLTPKYDPCYSVREILLITEGVTRIPANCSGLIEKQIMETIQCLMEDEKTNKIIAKISQQIATAYSGNAGSEVDSAPKAVGKNWLCVYYDIRHAA